MRYLVLFFTLINILLAVPPELELMVPPFRNEIIESSEVFIDSSTSPPQTMYFLKTPLLATICTTSVHVFFSSCDSLYLNWESVARVFSPQTIYLTRDSAHHCTYPIIAAWGEVYRGVDWLERNHPPINFWLMPETLGFIIDTTSDIMASFCHNATFERTDKCNWELTLPTANCYICSLSVGSHTMRCRRDWPYIYLRNIRDGSIYCYGFYNVLRFVPICNFDTECYPSTSGVWAKSILAPPTTAPWRHIEAPVSINLLPYPRVIATDGFPSDTLTTLPDSIYIDICSGGCGLPVPRGYSPLYHFLLDSIKVEMIITWYGGEDTVESFISPGSFWFKPATRPLPWRRFGVLVDSTSLPRAYTGPVRVCLMDVTNSPVVKFGPPVHLHPVGVYPFDTLVVIRPESVKVIGGDTIIFPADTVIYPGCVPKPAEPVCWNFYITSGVTQREETSSPEIFVSFSDGQIIISGQLPINGSLELYDITGKVVLRREISAKGSEKITIDGLGSGVYFIRLVNGKGVW